MLGAPCLSAKANYQHLEKNHIAQGKEPAQFSPRLLGRSRSFPGLAEDNVAAEGTNSTHCFVQNMFLLCCGLQHCSQQSSGTLGK